MSAERYSEGFKKHIRREKEITRREQPAVTLTSWDTISNMLEIRTHNTPEANDLFRENRQLLKLFYDGWFDVAAGRGRKKLNKLSRQYTQNTKSKYYNPELIDQLGPFISTIRDSFPATRSKK